MSRLSIAAPSLLDRTLQGPWAHAAGAAAGSFVVGYVVLPGLIGRTSALAFLPRLLGVLLAFALGSIAIYNWLQSRIAEPEAAEMTMMDPDPVPLQRANATLAAELAAQGKGGKVLPPPPSDWSAEVIATLDSKRFESVCAHFFAEKGMRVELSPAQADGSADILLWRDLHSAAEAHPESLARTRGTLEPIDEAALHELLNDAAAAQIESSFFIAAAGFSAAARDFARSRHITLLDSKLLLAMIQRLDAGARQRLLAYATAETPHDQPGIN